MDGMSRVGIFTDDNLENAAGWLQRRINELITETERKYGVYIASTSKTTPGDDFTQVVLNANVWPEAMRIIETERDSNAIG